VGERELDARFYFLKQQRRILMYFSFPVEEEGYTEVLVSKHANTPPILKLRAIEVIGHRRKEFKARVREGINGNLIKDHPFLFESVFGALDKAREIAKEILKERKLLN
jgi:hypothetical protein